MIVECPGCQRRYDLSGRPALTKARCRCGTVFELPSPSSEAGYLACPRCGASVEPTNHRCEFCDTALLVKACPRCFGRMFHGHKHCHHCGAAVDVPAHADPDGETHPRRCPRCKQHPDLIARVVGEVFLDECEACYGVWLDNDAVERIVKKRTDLSARNLLGITSPRGEVPVVSADEGRMYVKCPDCDQLMKRTNFAQRSGIVVDVCRFHGTWFDHKELPAIVAFVSDGGIEAAEEHERAKRQDQESLQRGRDRDREHLPRADHTSEKELLNAMVGFLFR